MDKNASQYTPAQVSSIKGRIKAAAKKMGITIAEDNSQGENIMECYRSIPFEQDGMSDGRTFEGYAAVFNSPTRISGWEGDFMETISPGAFTRSLNDKMPALMFEHGK